MSFKVSWKFYIISILMSIGLYLIMQDLLFNICFVLLIKNMIYKVTGYLLFDNMIFLSLIFIPLTITHELLHGAAYRIFGGKLKYGFNGIYTYTLEVSGIALQRTKFLLVLLAPVTFISFVSLLIPGVLGGIIFLLNLSGSMGDLLMAFYLCKLSNNSYIIDRKYGFDVIDKK